MSKKQKPQASKRHVSSPEAPQQVRQTLDEHLRQLIAAKLPELLDAEVEEYLGRERYEHHAQGEDKQYRNGLGKARRLYCGLGCIPVRVPRLRERYESQIVARYQRLSEDMRLLLPQLYAHGLATNDFAPCFEQLLGEDAPLSPNTIVRLKAQWQEEFKAWQQKPLEAEYLYVYVDGVYPKVGPKDEKMALLVAIGVNRLGEKHVLAILEGYRESMQSWRELFRQLKSRGVKWIGMVIADGVDSVRKALREVFPKSREQRCWVHKMRNVLDKVPNVAEDEVKAALQAMYNARSREEALRLKTEFAAKYQERYPRAVASLEEAGALLFTYFDFPKEHWKSIKTTNPLESMFSSVRLRTDAARRIPVAASGTHLVFKVLTHAETRLRRIHGYKTVAETIDRMQRRSQ